MRKFELSETTVGEQRVAGHYGLGDGAADARRNLRAARAANVRQKSLQHGEVGGAVGLQRERLLGEIHRAGEIELGVVADHAQRVHVQRLPFNAETNRRGIAKPVIEKREVDLIDR